MTIVTDVTNLFCVVFAILLVFEHALRPSLKLNRIAYSIFPRIHMKCQYTARGTKVHFN